MIEIKESLVYKISRDIQKFLTHDGAISHLEFDAKSRIFTFTVRMPHLNAHPFDYEDDDVKAYRFTFLNAELVNRPYSFDANWEDDSGEIISLQHYLPFDHTELEGCILDYRIFTTVSEKDEYERWEFRALGFELEQLD